MNPMNPATIAQIKAADPQSSTWVSANAGSGKTRVLTDRVARLLLNDVPPQRVLCLTYTKAAASHMQNQLFVRLGQWAMLSDEDLRANLLKLGEDQARLTSEFLRKSRTLFARALETPGGLKIQTIHSFCASLLRQFPLEAGVSPMFQEMDDRSGKKLRADILEDMAIESAVTFDAMAEFVSGDNPDDLMLEISRHRSDFDPAVSRNNIYAAFELPDNYGVTTYIDRVFPDWAGDILTDLIEVLHSGKPTDVKNAIKISQLDLSTPSMSAAIALEEIFVFGFDKAKPNSAKLTSFPTRELRLAHPDLMEAVATLMLRFEAEKPRRLALLAARKTDALHQFATAFLSRYEARKQLHGWLDFDDLILKARNLLTDSSMAQWVLFKLDGGIDHILVDEAQDTSPAQWQVITRLAEEFSTGQSAREIERTLFVVGDEKQSIYSFQGADPAAFDQMRKHFSKRLEDSKSALNRRELLYSFRSSSAILSLVDVVVNSANRADISIEVTHKAFHEDLPGRVDLWPFLEKPEQSDHPVWYQPLDMPLPDDPTLELAKDVANSIKKILDDETSLSTTDGSRRIVPGDFLILVQRRSEVFHEIIKALKDIGLPVAGADRLKVGGELAVKDLTALLAFLSTPEDDLSLASALRSPLFRLSERDLYQLASARQGFLWSALRQQKDLFAASFEILNDLLNHTDFQRPYELLDRILTRHNGREHLVARLGKEAEDGIDALQTQALQYEQMEAPSLVGFLSWMSTDESDVKRQMDALSNEIRVMTVHGAKGLESPIVILPDTANRRPSTGGDVLKLESGLATWKSAQAECPDIMLTALEARRRFQEEERLRLLYVAMTRAENWLIVCGAGTQGKNGDCWYDLIASGLGALGTKSVPDNGKIIQRYEPVAWSSKPVSQQSEIPALKTEIPEWASCPAPAERSRETRINPSDLGGTKIVGSAEEGLDETAAMIRGSQIHLLLEHLPSLPPSNWANAAENLLGFAKDDPEMTALLDEATKVISKPELAFLFAAETLAEVAITAPMQDGVLNGVVDRLILSEGHVLAVDFKSNVIVPSDETSVPLGLLRQMGAYSAALSQIYPNRQIETAILWTKTTQLMPLRHEIVTEAFVGTSTS